MKRDSHRIGENCTFTSYFEWIETENSYFDANHKSRKLRYKNTLKLHLENYTILHEKDHRRHTPKENTARNCWWFRFSERINKTWSFRKYFCLQWIIKYLRVLFSADTERTKVATINKKLLILLIIELKNIIQK